jgi:hypothetical protein
VPVSYTRRPEDRPTTFWFGMQLSERFELVLAIVVVVLVVRFLA